eukprot:TRINITY_DN3277_c0_g1_i2.p1 TRINITY_DN3277_c0_g1~~TRINITY_DN3277_c0_g1_i2.p1  ORF type:complete len:158 (-),score=17.55 TRINITY_DN3277_c0_g1_i2:6-479(-)
MRDLQSLGARYLIESEGGLYNLLSRVFPSHPWKQEMFIQQKKSSQRNLLSIVKQVLPQDTDVIENYVDNAWRYESGKQIELDIYIPTMKLAFEYQGAQHYHDNFMFGPSVMYKEIDKEKRDYCNKMGIALLHVPYWWKKDQLQEIISTMVKEVVERH